MRTSAQLTECNRLAYRANLMLGRLYILTHGSTRKMPLINGKTEAVASNAFWAELSAGCSIEVVRIAEDELDDSNTDSPHCASSIELGGRAPFQMRRAMPNERKFFNRNSNMQRTDTLALRFSSSQRNPHEASEECAPQYVINTPHTGW